MENELFPSFFWEASCSFLFRVNWERGVAMPAPPLHQLEGSRPSGHCVASPVPCLQPFRRRNGEDAGHHTEGDAEEQLQGLS